MSAEHLPVVIVDDLPDHAVRRLSAELRLGGWSVEIISDLDEAARTLVDRTEPYVLVLDYDFERPDGRTGMDLAQLLRTAHPYGPALPICCYSGRLSGEAFLEELRRHPLGAPTSFTDKASDIEISEVVATAENTFNEFRLTYEKQALRRALTADDFDDEDDELRPDSDGFDDEAYPDADDERTDEDVHVDDEVSGAGGPR